MSWLISLLLAGSILTGGSAPLMPRAASATTSPATTSAPAAEDSERFDQTYPLTPGGRVGVSNVNGSITVETWDRNEVRIEAVKTAEDKERLDDVRIKVDARADSVRVETEFENRNDAVKGSRGFRTYSKLTVDYKISVPRDAVLDEIETVNGSVSIANASNVTKASAVNGQVKATNLSGTATLSTVNGTVEASFDQLPPTGKIELETVNGQVLLTLPSDANATLKAETVNGSIANEFGFRVRKGQWVGRDLYGRVGTGEAKVSLSSVNGALSIKRRQDGRNANPTIDLLPPKDLDREDAELMKIDREAQRVSAEAMKVSRKDMEKARAELDKARVEMDKMRIELPVAMAIDPIAIDREVRLAMEQQKDALAQMSEAGFLVAAPAVEKKSETFAVNGVPTVSVDAKGCNVAVRGWDRQEVSYSVTRVRRTRDDKPLEFTVDRSESKITLRVAPKTSDGVVAGLDRIRIEVFVPKKSNLRILTDREIRLENVSGEIDLRGFGESIDVRDADGSLRVASANGRIRVIGFKGAVQSENADGEMFLEGDFSRLDARTADGNVFITVPESLSATLRSNNDVRFDGVGAKVVQGDGSERVWQLGAGANPFVITSDDGAVTIRSSASLRAGN